MIIHGNLEHFLLPSVILRKQSLLMQSSQEKISRSLKMTKKELGLFVKKDVSGIPIVPNYQMKIIGN